MTVDESLPIMKLVNSIFLYITATPLPFKKSYEIA